MIKRSSLADEVAQRLQEQISSGVYKINEKLPAEPALMEGFGVGRSTIREAVRILANVGILRVQQGLGTFVAASESIEEPLGQRLKRAAITDLDEVRQLLEVKVAQKAALNRSQKDVENIGAYLARRKEAAQTGEVIDCITADINFHIAIAEASGNSILTDLYKTVAHHMKDHFLAIFKNTEKFSETQPLHKNLYNSIIAQDAQKALQWAQRIVHFNEDEPTKKK
ncbi:FadR/GntR family transcriptional regulator [Chitinophaga tropicalis]|uniref:FCD domain-containing protein n=1 Tax=Chitinophaga tropicalis TaxID=2683588 RepID=A0A7K1TZF6_9BACT|nr:FadR/GntR family transcriptional regulator [Chitinophaga tropicalis]MVT07473.1 FCD domain-containing protein [Chitinophaga tropicalis]